MRWGAAFGILLLLAGAARAQEDRVANLLRQLHATELERVTAVAKLREAGPAVFGRVLKEYGRKDPRPVRRAVADLLRHHSGSMDTVDKHASRLVGMMRDPDHGVRSNIRMVLGKCGPGSARALERLLGARHADARIAGATRLAKIESPEARAILRANLRKDNVRRRIAALLGIASVEPASEEHVMTVLPLLGDPDPRLRRRAAHALGRMRLGSDAVIDGLRKALSDKDATVRAAAANALAHAASEQFDLLVAELGRARGSARALLQGAIRTLPAGAHADWEKAFAKGRDPVLLASLPTACLPRLSEPTRAMIVAAALDPSVARRRAALAALAKPEWPDRAATTEALVAAARDPDPVCRARAMRGLGRLDGDAARSLLTGARSDPDAQVRMEAEIALWHALEPDADPVPACVALAAQDPSAVEHLTRLRQFAWPATGTLAKAARSSDPRVAAAAVRALGAILSSPPAEDMLRRHKAFARLPSPVLRAAAKGLRWLASAQEEDGRWASARWNAHPGSDVGLTGLAVLAFLAAGQSDTNGAYAPMVRNGVRFLIAQQQDDGHIGIRTIRSAMVQHAIATAALAEAASVGRSVVSLHPAVRKALDFIQRARNPDLAWRYTPRSGDNDTYIAAWMVTALRLGERAGYAADRAAYAGAIAWIDSVTEPNFGYIGYDRMLGRPARPVAKGGLATKASRSFGLPPPPIPPIPPTGNPLGGNVEEREEYERKRAEYERAKAEHERLKAEYERKQKDSGEDRLRRGGSSTATTAAGAWIRLLDGSERDEAYRKAVLIVLEQPPVWKPAEWTIDLCAWHWSALVLTQEDADKWRSTLERKLFKNQNADGCWSPVGIWGPTGGTVFSTASATLALLAPVAYPRGCLDPTQHRERHAVAYAAFENAYESDDMRIHLAAAPYRAALR